jgi:hypothetical protein
MTEQAGGWTGWNFEIPAKDKTVFAEAVAGLKGVKYTPLAVATQVVAGINYAFLSEGVVVHPNAKTNVFVIRIYAPLPGHGEPHVTGITPVEP